MIKEIYIENIAVIKKMSINFNQGLSVITGETGAGKSILIDALNAILGNRLTKNMIRTGEEKALVVAMFSELSQQAQDKLFELGFEPLEEITLQREFCINGKSSARVNGRPASISVLKELASCLVAINGQNESYELLNPEVHIRYLDSIGNHEGLLADYRTKYARMTEIKSELHSIDMDETQKARELDILRYQINEIESAHLESGESEALKQRRDIISNSERISTALNKAKYALNGDVETEGAVSSLETAISQVGAVESYYDDLQGISERLNNALYEISDCAAEISAMSDGVEYDEGELNDIETRLDVISRLSGKYGNTEEEILNFLDKIKDELKSITFSAERIENLRNEYEVLKKEATELASRLTEKRLAAGTELAKRVKRELLFLDMPKVDFEVRTESSPLNNLGADKMEFLISVNPGEPPKPISKIASGGELSRIMLAIKTVLAKNDDISTLIFDEIDTGISGSTSEKVGLKLREVSSNRQVMCVTHSAQIACVAHEHFLITKDVRDGRTYTDIIPLDFEGRKQETARIIGGVKVTELTLRNAEEMLNQANGKEIKG